MTIPMRQSVRRFRLDVKTGKGTTAAIVDLCTYHAVHAAGGGVYDNPDVGVSGPVTQATQLKVAASGVGSCGCCAGYFALGVAP